MHLPRWLPRRRIPPCVKLRVHVHVSLIKGKGRTAAHNTELEVVNFNRSLHVGNKQP